MPESEGKGSSPAEALRAQRTEVAHRILELHYQSHPRHWERYGEEGRRLCQRDIDYHLDYLIASVEGSDPSFFLQYLRWVQGLFDNIGLPEGTVADMLAHIRQALRDVLPEESHRRIAELLDLADPNVDPPVMENALLETDEPSLTPVARAYVEALLRGDRGEARRLVLESSEGEASVQEIYLRVLQPAQREIGRLWYRQEISVAEEHYCTAATQLIMSALYPRIFDTPKTGKRLVAACAEGELHEIGARMVADFFELEGWDTYYLGANMPEREIAHVISAKRPDVLALSATLPLRLSSVARIVSQVNALSLETAPKIIVGGRAFAYRPDLYREIGAHGYASDAEGAVALVNDLLDTGSG